MREAYKILVEKFGQRRPLGSLRQRGEDNIVVHLKKLDLRVWTEFHRSLGIS
jgi:hypothetical protein